MKKKKYRYKTKMNNRKLRKECNKILENIDSLQVILKVFNIESGDNLLKTLELLILSSLPPSIITIITFFLFMIDKEILIV